MVLDWSLQHWLALACSLLIISFALRIFATSRSSLHVLPGPRRASLLLGNVAEAALFSSSEINHLEEWTDTYGGTVRIHGLLGTQPELCISDPEFIHRVYITDAELWGKPYLLKYFVALMFGPGVFVAEGDEHRRQRKILNPMFTAAHTRNMTPGMYDVAHKLCSKISGIIASEGTGSAVIDVLKLTSATALDIVGTAGLGHDFDALGKESVYARAIKEFSPTIGEIQVTAPLLEPLSYLGPYSFRSWVMDTFCPFLGGFGRSVMNSRRILRTMDDTARTVYRDRQSLIANENALGGATQFSKTDVLSNLVRASSQDFNVVVEEAEAVSNINAMVFAGHETTSNALSCILEILSTQQDLQENLRAEVLKARVETGTTEDVPYDILVRLPLLDAVVRETLRLHPPVPMLTRKSLVDTIVPLAHPVKSADGKAEVKEIFVPRDTTVHISIAGMNRSRAVWGDDAKEFKPERWLGAGPTLDLSKIPGTFSSMMTFSSGNSSCLGWRMAVLEIKLVLAVLLQRFTFDSKNNQNIKWMCGATSFPVVIGEEAVGARLPLVVSEITV